MRAAFLIITLCWSSFVSQDSNEVATRFNRAAELQRQGALAEAATDYRTLLKIAPTYA